MLRCFAVVKASARRLRDGSHDPHAGRPVHLWTDGRLFSVWYVGTIGDRSISSNPCPVGPRLEVLDRVDGWDRCGPSGVIEDPAHWLLLTEMARNAGFTTGSLARKCKKQNWPRCTPPPAEPRSRPCVVEPLWGDPHVWCHGQQPNLSDRRLIRDASSIFGGATVA